MKTTINSFEFIAAIANHLNFDPTRVHSLTISAEAGDIVRVKVEFIPTEELLSVLRNLNFEDKSDGS